MKILVTGGTGFVGGHVLNALDGVSAEVVATCRKEPAARRGVRWVVADLLTPGVSAELIDRERPTHLIHLGWRSVHGPVANARDNFSWITASLNLASAFVDAGGRRIVSTGSCFEYDWSDGVCVEDRTPLVPATLYGAAKTSLHSALAGLTMGTETSLVWPRVFFLYGPGEHLSRFVMHVARCLLSGVPAEMTEGSQQRDFLYAADAAEALVQLALSDACGVFNVASGATVTLREIAEEIGRQTGRGDLLRIGARQPKAYEPQLILGDATRIAEVVGWKATTSLQAGIASTLDSLRARS